MKVHILGLSFGLMAILCLQIEASAPVFGFAPAPAPAASSSSASAEATHSEHSDNHFDGGAPAESQTTSTTPAKASAPSKNPFGSIHAALSEPTEESSHENPPTVASPTASPFSITPQAPTSSVNHDKAMTHETSPEADQQQTMETHAKKADSSKDHAPTIAKTASIPTLHIAPGHDTPLAPLIGEEAHLRYFIQDKSFEPYLHETITKTATHYSIMIPEKVQTGSFTIFKTEGTGIHPEKLQPAYHVVINGLVIEGTQFPQQQNSSALEQLKELEQHHLADMQTSFKEFMKDVRHILDQASTSGESLATAKPALQEKVTTLAPLTLPVGATHELTSFAGGSAQSTDPAVVSVTLQFKGTKQKPEWHVMLATHKEGEATITYSSGTETFEQPIFVKTAATGPVKKDEPLKHLPQEPTEEESEKVDAPTIMPEEKDIADDKSESTDTHDSDEPIIPLDEEGPIASFLRTDENLPGEAADEEQAEEKQEPSNQGSSNSDIDGWQDATTDDQTMSDQDNDDSEEK